jgi:hypothetical protein
MAKTKLENIAPFGLRLQPDLRAKLEAQAQKVPRSLNAEISERLEKSLMKQGLADYTDGELIDELVKRFRRDGALMQLIDKLIVGNKQ